MYKYNELAYANLILEKGFTSKYINNELRILAKYYKYKGYKPSEREKLLYDFCEKHLQGYDRVKYYKNINAALNHAKKKENKIIEISNIEITDKELEYIEQINLSSIHRTIIFTLLVIDKLNNATLDVKYGNNRKSNHYFGGNEKRYKELATLSCIPSIKGKSSENIHTIINDLSKIGILEIKGNGFIYLKFIDDIDQSTKIKVKINNFSIIGLYYEYHKGENKVRLCENCKIPIRIKSNRTKYCKTCWKIKEAEDARRYARDSMRRKRNVKGLENGQNP